MNSSQYEAAKLIARYDARIKVEVPAIQGRKAYSYYREGSESEAKKFRGGKAIAAGIGGALAIGGVALLAKKVSEGKSKDYVMSMGDRFQSTVSEGLPSNEVKKMPTQKYLGLAVGGMIGLQVVREKVDDVKTFSQFKKDREELEKQGIPPELKKAYQHMSPDLALSVVAAEMRIKDNKDFETMYAFDPNGKPLFIRAGSAAFAGPGLSDMINLHILGKKKDVSVITHNHPMEASLSGQDFAYLEMQSKIGFTGLTEMRATTSSNIYSIRSRKGEILSKEGVKERTSFEKKFFQPSFSEKNAFSELKQLQVATSYLDDEVLGKYKKQGLKGKKLLAAAVKELDERGEERHQAIKEAYRDMNRRYSVDPQARDAHNSTGGRKYIDEYKSTPSKLIYTRFSRGGK